MSCTQTLRHSRGVTHKGVRAVSSTEDSFPILGIDYVQFFVGNAKQAAHYYESFGFTPRAFMGLETGSRDRVSYMVQQGDVRLVFTGALDGDSAIAEHVKLHRRRGPRHRLDGSRRGRVLSGRDRARRPERGGA